MLRYYSQGMKNYIIEYIGTFFLVLTIALTGNPLAIGTALMVMVYMGGYISGAHYNPAVTFACLMNKAITPLHALFYVFAQLAGAFTAAFLYRHLTGMIFVAAPGPDASLASAYLVEAIFTFVLAYVVLNTAVSTVVKNNSYYGVAIGATVFVAATAGGSISGGAFNPAVGLGPMLYNLSELNMEHMWLYIAGPLIGGGIAGVLYKFTAVEGK